MFTILSTRSYPAQFSPVHILTFYFSCIHFNIIHVYVSQVTPQSHTAERYTVKPVYSGTARDRFFFFPVVEFFRVSQVLDFWIRGVSIRFSLRQVFFIPRFRSGQVSLYKWIYFSTVISQHVSLSCVPNSDVCFLTVSSGFTKVLKPITQRIVTAKDG